MRATDIIRDILDLIDRVEQSEQTVDQKISTQAEPIQTGVDTNRFKHIYAMLSAERDNPVMYDNTPNKTVCGIDSVTVDAGGGLNGPKNPADMRADSVAIYPDFANKRI
jgi:hypothetical protein